ncbi:MAG: M20/M25/M40 family metallo-hydrolase [Planctomycetota bacterium]
MKSPRLACLCLLVSLAVGARAQLSAPAAPAKGSPTSAAALRATLDFLASDDLAGRDSPSRGLDRARDYLIERVRAVGLAPGVGDGFRHRYTLPGTRLDPGPLVCRVRGTEGEVVELAVEKDVRVWRADAGYDNEDVEFVRVDFAQPGVDRMLRAQRGRRPVVVEVEDSSPLWSACAGARSQVARGGRGGAPWLLVRKGVLPAGDLRGQISLPAPQAADIDLENVVATLRVDGAKEWVLFTAHYDHVGIGAPRGGDAIYNGADDDASGSAAVLALAEAFVQRSPRLTRNLAFVWFSAEEKGLRGSRAFVEDSPLPIADIAAVVNLEMLGRPPAEGPRKAWITGEDLSDFGAIARPIFSAHGVDIVDFVMAGQLFYQSDNLPFAQKGVVAHAISAGSLHQDYHQPGDEVEKLDLEHMSAVVEAVYAFGVELASRDERPQYNDRGKQTLSGGRGTRGRRRARDEAPPDGGEDRNTPAGTKPGSNPAANKGGRSGR